MAIKTDTIVTRYEVVTINHEQGVERIKQKQLQLNATLKDWNEEAKRVEQVHTAAWKKAGLALAGVTAAVIAGRAAFVHYAKESKLTAASAGVDIAQLDKAAGGLQTRMQLLEFAAKTQAGAFKLTTEQMRDAQLAIRALVRSGYDQEEVTKKVTDAIVKLEGDGLKDFGIRVRESKTDGEKFNAVMEALQGKAKGATNAVQTETEGVQALGVRFQNAGDQIVSSLGRIVVAMTPLLEGVAKLAGVTADMVGNVGAFADLMGTGLANITGDDGEREIAKVAWGKRHGFDLVARDPIETMRLSARASGTTFTAEDEARARASLASSGAQGDFAAAQRNAARRMQQRGGAFGGDYSGIASDIENATERTKKSIANAKEAKKKYDAIWNQALLELVESAAPGAGSDEVDPWAFSDSPIGEVVFEQPALDFRALDKYGAGGEFDKQAYGEFNRNRSQSKLAEMFGPIQDFNVYTTAFQTLSGAVGSAMTAWIDGSKSAAAAFKEFISQALGGIAVQMAMEALKHGAYAIGSLAFGDIRGAATHGKAAAAFAAGAIVVGAAAKAMHSGSGGSASAGGGAAAAPTYAPSGGGGGGGVTQQTIVYGPDYTNQSSRMRQLHAKKMLDTAKGSPGVVYG